MNAQNRMRHPGRVVRSFEHVPHPTETEAYIQPAGIEAHIEPRGVDLHAEIDQLLRRCQAGTVWKGEAAHMRLSPYKICARVQRRHVGTGPCAPQREPATGRARRE